MLTHDRRQFLKMAAASSLYWGEARANTNHKMTSWLACGTLGVRANQREAIDLAHRHGFQSVEPLGEELMSLSDGDRKRLTDDLRAKGLSWGTAGMRLGFNLDETQFSVGMKGLPQLAKALQSAGVTRIYRAILPSSDALTYTENFKLHVNRIRAVATVMEDHGLRLGLEYAGPKTAWSSQRFPFIHSMTETRELIAATGKKNVGLDLDTFHWYTAHETAADLLKLTNHDIVLVDACDAPGGVPIDEQIRDRRQLPCATGTIDLASVMNALKQIGYDGPVRADPLYRATDLPKDEAVSEAAKAVQRLFALIR